MFPKDPEYHAELNALYRKLAQTPEFDYLANFELNSELMLFLTNLNDKYKIYMFTSGTIQNAPEIKDKVEENC